MTTAIHFNQDYINTLKTQFADTIEGTVSYSGADYKAVVFLPRSLTQIKEEREKLDQELAALTEVVRTVSGYWDSLSIEYNNAILTGWPADEVAIITRDLRNVPIKELTNARAQMVTMIEQVKKLDKLIGTGSEQFSKPITLGNLQTVTISSHREKFPVRTCGRVYAKSYTRGPRTLAGSLIFTVMNKHAMWELVQSGMNMYNTGVGVTGNDSSWPEISTMLVDQLPPFDITIVASNEVGDSSYMVLYGVEIVNEGQTMSIQDLITENAMQFFCRDFDPLRPMDSKRATLTPGESIFKAKTADQILAESGIRRKRRLNPFI